MNSIPRYQLSKNTIRQMIENISDGIETVIWDNYGYPNIMYVLNREAFQKHFDRKFYTTLDTTALDVSRTTVVTEQIIEDGYLRIPQFPNMNYSITFELRDSSNSLKHTCVYGTDYIIENGLYLKWGDKTTSSLYLSIAAGDNLYYSYRHTLTPAAFTVRDYDSTQSGISNQYTVKNLYDNIFISKYRAALTDGNIPVSLPGALQDLIDIGDCQYRDTSNDYYLFPSDAAQSVVQKGDGWRPTNSIELGALKFLRSSTIFTNRFKRYTQNRRRLGGSPYFTSIPNLYDIYTSNINNNEHINLFKTEKKTFFNTDKNTSVKLGLRVPGVLDKIVNFGWTIRSDYSDRYDTKGSFIPLTVPSSDGSEWLTSPDSNELSNVFVPGQYLFDSSGNQIMRVVDYKEQLDCRISDLDSTNVVFTGVTYQGYTMTVEHDIFEEERGVIISITATSGGLYYSSICFSTNYESILTYPGSIPNGQTLIINGITETATLNGTDVTSTCSGLWPKLTPGVRYSSFRYLDDPDSAHIADIEISVPVSEDSKFFFQPYSDTTEMLSPVFGIRCRLIAEPLSSFYNIFTEHPYFEEVRNSNLNPINKITDILNSDYTKSYPGIHTFIKKLDVYYHPANSDTPDISELEPISVEFKREIDSTTELGVPINVFLINNPVTGLYEQDFDYSTEYCSDSYSFFNEYAPGVIARKYLSPITYVIPGPDGTDTTESVYPVRLCTLKNNTAGYNFIETSVNSNKNLCICSKEFFDETTGNYFEHSYIRYISSDIRSNGTLDRYIYAKSLLDNISTNNMFTISIDSLTEGIYSVINTRGAGWNVIVGVLENNFIFGINQNWFSTTTDSTALPYSFQPQYRLNTQEDIKNFSMGNPVYNPILFRNYSNGARFRYRKFFPGEVYVSEDGETYETRPLTLVKVDNSPLGYEFVPIGLNIYNTYVDTDLTIRLSDCLLNSTDKYQNALIKHSDPHYSGMSGINAYEMVEIDFSDPANFISNNLDNIDIEFARYYSLAEAFKFWSPLHECQGIVDIPPTKVAYRMTYLPGDIENIVDDEPVG